MRRIWIPISFAGFGLSETKIDMYFVLTASSEEELSPILKELQANSIQYHLEPDTSGVALHVADHGYVQPVRQAYDAYLTSQYRVMNWNNVKAVPVTLFVIVSAILVAMVTKLGSKNESWFFIAEYSFYPASWWLHEWPQQIWFSISPVFLHFGWEHIIFNVLSFWIFASLIERKLGTLHWVLALIALSLISNYAQLIFGGPLFGGLSGVVYGLISFSWGYQKTIAPLYLPNGLFYFAFAWLLLGYTPFFQWIGIGSMANTAHLSGAIAGLAWFLFYRLTHTVGR